MGTINGSNTPIRFLCKSQSQGGGRGKTKSLFFGRRQTTSCHYPSTKRKGGTKKKTRTLSSFFKKRNKKIVKTMKKPGLIAPTIALQKKSLDSAGSDIQCERKCQRAYCACVGSETRAYIYMCVYKNKDGNGGDFGGYSGGYSGSFSGGDGDGGWGGGGYSSKLRCNRLLLLGKQQLGGLSFPVGLGIYRLHDFPLVGGQMAEQALVEFGLLLLEFCAGQCAA